MSDWYSPRGAPTGSAISAMRPILGTSKTGTSTRPPNWANTFSGTSIGGFPYIGTPDKMAEELATVGRAGLRGVALSFVNYLDDLPYFRDEVLPRLERMGLREPRSVN